MFLGVLSPSLQLVDPLFFEFSKLVIMMMCVATVRYSTVQDSTVALNVNPLSTLQ